MLLRMFFTHLALSFLMGTPSPSAVAEVRVGPRDGMRVESLPPVAMPTVALEEKIADTKLPLLLEQEGYYAMAGVEWQRVALQSHGPDELNAWLHAGQTFGKAGKTQSATASFQHALLAAEPARQPEVLYHLSLLTQGASRTTVLETLATTPQNPWARAALWAAVTDEAAKGPFTQTYNLPEAEDLRQQQTHFTQKAEAKALLAAAVGVIPGAGHMVEGDFGHGSMMLLFTALFALAFLSACRHKHYAYAFLLVVPAVSLWLNSPLLAHKLAMDNAATQWQTLVSAQKGKIVPPAAGTTPQEALPTTTAPAVPVSAADLPAVHTVTTTAPLAPQPLSVPMLTARPSAAVTVTVAPSPTAPAR